MSLANCLTKINSGKTVFSETDLKDIRALVNQNMGKMTEAEAEKFAVQSLLDEALADQQMVMELVREGMGLPRVVKVKPTANQTGDLFAQQVNPIPINKQLTGKDAEIQTRFRAWAWGNLDKAIAQYQKANGNVLNVDEARKLSPDYHANADSRSLYSSAVHETASWLIKEIYERELAKPTPNGAKRKVVFTAGGTGAGKSTSIKEIPEMLEKVSTAQIVFDTNMNGFESAHKKIMQALNASFDIDVLYVYRDPLDALHGMLGRAMNPKSESYGRVVPLESHVATHVGASKAVRELVEAHKDNGKVAFSGINNTFGKGNSQQVELAKLPVLAHNSINLEVYREAVRKQHREKRITDAVLEGTLGKPALGIAAGSGTHGDTQGSRAQEPADVQSGIQSVHPVAQGRDQQPATPKTVGDSHESRSVSDGSNEGKSPATTGGTASERTSGSVRSGAFGRNIVGNRLPLNDDSKESGVRPDAGLQQAGGDTQLGNTSGKGDRTGRNAGVPAGRDIPAKSGLNYHLTDSDLDYKGSWLTKARQNVEAVELIKKLAAEKVGFKGGGKVGRQATREEQSVLAKFIGWGASEIRNKIFGDDLDAHLAVLDNYEEAITNLGDKPYLTNSNYRAYQPAFAVLQAKNPSLNWYTAGNITRAMLDAAKPDQSARKWGELRDRLKAVMSDEEWTTAERSTQYAHYTGKEVVNEMWRALDRFGFKGGAVLEPGAGNGVFPGLMPAALANNSAYTGIEFDALTGAILKHLQPDERILVESYIDSALPDNFYDVAIGNPPFSDAKILSDPRYKKHGFALHDYFFAKTMDKVKPGGLVVFVTSRYTMDRQGDKARQYLAERADLLGAIRLPETAFKKNAGTEVVTDILFLRKKVPGETFEGHAWMGLDKVTVKGGEHQINQYFAAHPEMVLGEGAIDKNGMYGANQYTVLPNKDVPIEVQLAAAIDKLPRDVFRPESGSAAQATQVREIDWNPKAKKEGNYYVGDNGKLMQVENRIGVPPKVRSKADEAMIKDFVALRDAVSQAQYDQLNSGDWEKSLKALQKEYHAFTKKHGHILQNTVVERKETVVDEHTGEEEDVVVARRKFTLDSKLNDDPEYTKVRALESINDDTGEITQSDFLTKRTLDMRKEAVISTPHDALLSSLNGVGRVDIPLISERIGLTDDETIAALGTSIYQSPSAGWQMADEYLSGNVKKKLKEAQEAAKSDRKYERNVQALLEAQPSPVPPSDITASLGMNWVPTDIYEQFLKEKTGVRARVSYNEHTGTWSVSPISGLHSMAATADWGTPKRNAADILEAGLTGRPIRITETVGSGSDRKSVFDAPGTEAAIQKLKEMRAAFRNWLWEDAERTDNLVRLYNDKFNTTVARKFDGRHLTLPGSSTTISVFDHVKRGAWRIIQTGNTYLAHAVGAGKAQPLDAKVLTPDGWKLMGAINVGDFVVSADGNPTRVEAVFPQGEKEIFRVEFNDGSATECCDEHLWLTQTYKERSAHQRAIRLGKHWPHGMAKVRSLAEIRETLIAQHLGAKNHSIPMVAPVQFSARTVEIDPYVMGVLLGDGGLTGSQIVLSSADDEILDEVKRLLPAEHELVHYSNYDYAIVWRGQIQYAVGGGCVNSHPMMNSLRTMGIMGKPSHKKHIPDDYLFNSVESRIAVLQGLMDTDGHVESGGTSSRFCTTSRQLADDVKTLVQSLGGVALEREKQPSFTYKGVRKLGRVAYDICVKLPATINPFRLSRKANKVIPKSKYAPIRYITAIESVGKKLAQCIRVADPSHLYVTDDFIVTHNTWAMVISAMEQKRLGLINKPMMVVPNHMLQQFAQEWLQLYPAARLMVADEKQFHTDNRRRFVARAAMSDLDGVIITHSAYKLLDLDPEFKKKVISEEINYLAAALEEVQDDAGEKPGKGKSRNPKVRDIQNRIEKMEEKLKAAMSGEGKDKSVRFDEIGVDMIYVDEAHEFRKLAFTTVRQMKGIDSSGSDRAFDLHMKTRWLEERHQGRSLVMASGTPITNTIAELYSVQRFMQPADLEERGLHDFDAWASMFGEESTEIEADASGKYAPVTRFANFVNVPELTQMFRNFADVLTSDNLAEMLGDKRPKVKDGSRKLEVTPQIDDYLAYKEILADRLKKSKLWKPSRDEPNNPDPVIRIIGDGRLAAIDMRFIDPTLPSDPNSKLNQLIDGVVRVYHETADNEYNSKSGNLEPIKGGAQMVFSDLGFGAGVTEHRGFNARAWLEKRLRDAGIPIGQVAFMSDHKKSDAKVKLFKDVNAGRVRILIGSSKNMGTGVNAQQRLIALHHLDTPWFPADLEQREGRIIRQGNKNPHVQIYAYSTKGSYDTNMWQLLARKQGFINQALSGDSSVRRMEDISEVSQFQMATAMTAGDERAIRLAGLKAEIDRYDRLFRAHEEQRMRMKESYALAGNTITVFERVLPDAEKLAAKVQDLSGDKFTAKAGGQSFNKRKEWGDALLAKVKDYTDQAKEGRAKVGELSSFDIFFVGAIDRSDSGKVIGYYARLEMPVGEDSVILARDPNDDAVGMSIRATNAITALARKPEDLRQRIAEAKSKRNGMEGRLDAKFQFAEEYTAKRREAEALEAEMLADSAKAAAGEEAQQSSDGDVAPLASVEKKADIDSYEIQPDTARNLPIDGATLVELRRAAAGIESAERGITFTINADGKAIVTGPARVKVPARFHRFANEHGLTLVVQRADTKGGFSNANTAMPLENREAGALYFGELGADHLDRTGKTRFSSSEKPVVGMSVGRVDRATTKLRASWHGFRRINVVKSVKDIPDGLYKRALRAHTPIDQGTEGIFDPMTNSVYLIADNIATPDRANWVAIHEVVGHGGIRMLDKPVADTLDHAAKNSFVAKLAKAIAVDRGETFNAMTHTDEAIAELAAATITGNVDAILDRYGVKVPVGMRSNLLGMIKRVVDAVRQFIGRVTGKPVEEVSDGDVLGLIRRMKDAVEGVEQGYDTAGVSNGRVSPLSQKGNTLLNGALASLPSTKDAFISALGRWFSMPEKFRASGLPLVVGNTPQILLKFGAQQHEIRIDRGTLVKTTREHGEHPKGHGITKEQLEQLPDQLANPVAIFEPAPDSSGAKRNGLIVLTSLMDTQGEQAIVAVHLSKELKGGLVINDIASVHGRAERELIGWAERDLLKYFDDTEEIKRPSWIVPSSGGLQLLARDGATKSLGRNVRLKSEIVKDSDDPLFSSAPAQKPNILRAPNKGGMESDTGLIDKAFRLPFKLIRWDRIVSKNADAILGKIGDLIPETVKAGVVSNYGLGPDYIDNKADMQAREAAQNRKAHGMIEILSGLTRAESRVAYYWMQEQPGSTVEQRLLEQLPEASRETMAKLKKLISDLGKEAVRLKQMSQESYERNNMAYLHRTYAKHVLAPDGWLGRYLQTRALKIKGNQYKGRGIFDEVSMSAIGGDTLTRKLQKGQADKQMVGEKLTRFERRDASTEAMEPLPGMTGKPMGKLREVIYWPAGTPVPSKFGDWVNSGTFEVRDTKGDKLVVWRDLTREERERLGELDEVRYAVAQTLQMMIHDIETGRMFEWTANKFGKVKPEGKEVSASESMLRAYSPDEWVQVPSSNIPGTQTRKYGTLAGLYVPGAIWNDIRQTAGGRIEPFGKTYASVLRFWKKSKTVWSATVHTNNVMANFVMADWADIRAVDLADALRVWAMNGKPGYKELFQRFEDSGALGGMFQSNEVMRDEIKARLDELKADLTGEQDAGKELGKMGKVLHLLSLVSVKPVKGSAEVMAKAYQNEDAFFRLAVFLKAVRHGKNDIEAGRMARHAFLNYDINAPWVQMARQTFLPFVSFFYRAAPLLLNTAKNKPWKIAKLVAFAYMVNALGYAMSGGGDDEDKDRKLMPPEKGGSVWGVVPKMIRMPWNHDDGSAVFLDVRRWVPVGDIADMEMGAGMMPPWATPSGPAMAIVEAALLNKSMFTEKEIVSDTDSLSEKTEKRLDYLFKSMMPNVPLPNPINLQLGGVGINPFDLDQGSFQSYSWSGIEKSVNRQENMIGEVKTTPAAIASALGIKLAAYPRANMEAAIALDFQRQSLEIQGKIKKIARDYSKLDDPTGAQTAAMERNIEAQKSKIEKAAEKMREWMD